MPNEQPDLEYTWLQEVLFIGQTHVGKVIVRSKGIPREDTSRTLKPGRKGRRKGHCVMLRRPRRWRIFLVSYTTITSISKVDVQLFQLIYTTIVSYANNEKNKTEIRF